MAPPIIYSLFFLYVTTSLAPNINEIINNFDDYCLVIANNTVHMMPPIIYCIFFYFACLAPNITNKPTIFPFQTKISKLPIVITNDNP